MTNTETVLWKNNNTLKKTIKYVSKFYLYEKVSNVDAKEDNAFTDSLSIYDYQKILTWPEYFIPQSIQVKQHI